MPINDYIKKVVLQFAYTRTHAPLDSDENGAGER